MKQFFDIFQKTELVIRKQNLSSITELVFRKQNLSSTLISLNCCLYYRFADIFGLDLQEVKTFTDEIPKIPRKAFQDLDVDINDYDIGSPRSNAPIYKYKPLSLQVHKVINIVFIVHVLYCTPAS